MFRFCYITAIPFHYVVFQRKYWNQKIFLRSEDKLLDHNVAWFITVKETVLWDVVNKKAGVTASFHFGVSMVKPQNVSSTPAKNSLVRLFLQVFSELSSIQSEFCGDSGFRKPN